MGKHEIQDILDSIEYAVEKECWIPALALTLTIPSVFGRVEYPDLVNKRGRPLDKKIYKKWFSEHVEHRYADESGWDDDGKAKNPYFNADMCYQLRCELLHAGGDDVDFEFNFEEEDNAASYDYEFELRIHACDSYGNRWVAPPKGEQIKRKTIRVCVDIKTLCDAMREEAQRLLDGAEDEVFSGRGISLVDVRRHWGSAV